jgi:isochorismate hydrolase
MRERRKIISLDADSALALMQEIYNDIVEQKNTASLITKKMLTFMKEAEDMSLIGPVIKEQQKILNDCTEKKISLVKLQGALLKQTGGDGFGKKSPGHSLLSPEDRKILEKLVADDEDIASGEDNDDEKYKT